MQYLLVVDMLQPKAQLHEPVQDERLLESLTPLLCTFDSLLEIASVTVVHDDMVVVFLNERVVVLDHVDVIQLPKDVDLVVPGSASVARVVDKGHTLHCEEMSILFPPHEVDKAVASTADGLNFFIVLHFKILKYFKR